MSLQRQYNLPNCRIVLEGLSNNNTETIDILMKAECHFTGIDQVLSGGQIFWQNLVQTVNNYAQECLSGLRHPLTFETKEDLILLTKNPENLTHLLTWQPQPQEATAEINSKVEIELNTVQLFDLIEAIDQFYADQTTLPEIKQNLQPLSRRFRRPDEPLAQRASSPVLGFVTVAIASFAFLLTPLPPEKKPVESNQQNKSTETLPKPIQPTPPNGQKGMNSESKPKNNNTQPQTPK